MADHLTIEILDYDPARVPEESYPVYVCDSCDACDIRPIEGDDVRCPKCFEHMSLIGRSYQKRTW